MIDILDGRTRGPVLGIYIEESVTEEDFEKISDEIERRIEEYGTVRLFVEYEEIPRVDLDAIDDDIKIWWKYRSDIERYAVVSEGTLMEWATDLADRLTGVEVEYFDVSDRAVAWDWICEGISE